MTTRDPKGQVVTPVLFLETSVAKTAGDAIATVANR